VIQILCRRTKNRLEQKEAQKLLKVEEDLKQQVIG
jgi:ATP-dependent Clp protease ATP-binding subunit ClpA